MSENNCWPREKLKEYLAGWADENQTQQIEAHLSQCTACEETIVALEKEPDTLVGIVSSLKQESHHNESSELEALLAKAGDLVHDGERADDSANDSVSRLPAPTKIGPYILQRSLGRGGMGSVYLARHQQLGKLVAIKLLPWRSTQREHFEARFQREVRAAGGLDHPSIVSATDAGHQDGTHYLVMEFIDGLDLSRLTRAMGQISLADACELIRQVALGLSHAHAEGIVHRDIKPSNLMLNRRGQVKILDFGLARLGPWCEESAELTTVGQLMGTLDYMAPEQAERAESVDYRADLYSLGATLFRLLCGRAPLAASPDQSPLAKLRLLATEEPPKLSTLRPDAPGELVQLVAQMLARDPKDRPASAAHVAERLQPFCQSHDLGSLLRTALEKTELLQTQTASQSKAVDDVELRQLSSSQLKTIAESNTREARGTGRSWAWIGIACAAMAGLFYCGITIWIDSQSGWLHIDSDAKVTIEIASENAPVKSWNVEPGANTTKLYAGKYRIILEQGSDGVQLDQEQLLVTKGGVAVAKVSKKERPGDPSVSPQTSTASLASVPPASTAVLVPGDALMISSQADEKFKHKFVIQADLTAKLPLIGTIHVAGLTVDGLEQELQGRYSKFFSHPAIEVFRDPSQAIPASPDARSVVANGVPSSSETPLSEKTIESAEPMYKGKPLSEWLRVVSLERSGEGVIEALQALSASISVETRERIINQLKGDLPKVRWHELPSFLPARDQRQAKESLVRAYLLAFGVLRKADASSYYEYVRNELQSTKDDQWRMVVLRHAIPEAVTSRELEPLKSWLNAQLSLGAASPYFEYTVQGLLLQIESPKSNDEDRKVWLSMLEECSHLQDRFWLDLPFASSWEGLYPNYPGALAISKWSGNYPSRAVCWQPVISRAIRVLDSEQLAKLAVDEASAPNERMDAGSAIVYATAVLLQPPVGLSTEQVLKLEEIATTWSERMTKSDRWSETLVTVQSSVARKFQHNLGSGSYSMPLQLALATSLAKYTKPTESLIEALVPGATRAIYAKMNLDPWSTSWENLDFVLRYDYDAIQLVDPPPGSGKPVRVKSSSELADTCDLCWLSVLSFDRKLYLDRLQQQLKLVYAAAILKSLDKDQDGRVNLAESSNGLLKFVEYEVAGATSVDEALRVFKQADTNQDESLSVDEYIAFRDQWQNDRENKITENGLAWATRQIEKYDKDKDGKLSQEERSKMMFAPPKGVDTNGDGYLDAIEYAKYRSK